MRKSPSILFSLADQSFLTTKSIGIFNVSVGLLRALSEARPNRDMVLFGEDSHVGLVTDRRTALRVISFGYAGKSRIGRMWYDQIAVYRAARRFPGAWLFLPKGYASFLVPPPRGVRLACYVHDTMQVHYRRRHPKFFPRLERAYFWQGFLATLRHSHAILTNSEFTADEVKSFARQRGIRTGAITRVGIGFHPTPPTPQFDSRTGIVVLASRMPHKLTSRAVEWFSKWQTQRGDFKERVHWVGSLPPGVRVDVFRNWKHQQRLDDAAYQKLMGGAQALVYFSEYEGYGMPPVEAVLCGAAPVYSDIPATREAMNQTGFSFGNDSYDSFAAALDQGLACRATAIHGWGNELKAGLGWSDVAERVLEALA